MAKILKFRSNIEALKKWGGDDIKIGGVDYKLVKFDDLMAILE